MLRCVPVNLLQLLKNGLILNVTLLSVDLFHPVLLR